MSVSVGLASVLAGVAAKVGAPVVKVLLEKYVGGTASEIGGTIIDAIAGKAGVAPDDLTGLDQAKLEQAVLAVEPEAPELVAAWVEQQKEANRLMLAEMEKGPVWTWAWRPGWMYLLGFFWIWIIVAVPVVGAITGADIDPLDPMTLMTLTGAYLALYMGGHTAKNIAERLKS